MTAIKAMENRPFLFKVIYDLESEERLERQIEYRLVYAATRMQAESKLRKQYNIPTACINMTIE